MCFAVGSDSNTNTAFNQMVFSYDLMEFLEKYTFDLSTTPLKLSRIASNPKEINRTRITSQSPTAVTPRESNLCVARGQNAKRLGIRQLLKLGHKS